MELSTMGGRRLTSQQLQQLQQQHQQQQQQHFKQHQFQQQQQHQYHQQQQHQTQQAMLFHQQHHQHQQSQQAPPSLMGPPPTNPLHRSAPRFHGASRHRKDSLGKSGGGKYMYPGGGGGGVPGSPTMGFAENIYHPQTGHGGMVHNSSANSVNSLAGNGKHMGIGRYPEPDPDVIEVYLEDDPVKLKEAVREGKEIKWRNNIVATMERYEPAPISAATLPSSYLHHQHQHSQHSQQSTGSSSTDSSLNPEYSYAYCEPMVLKAQQQEQLGPPPTSAAIPAIHKQLPSSASSNALSKLPSTNSLRALLSKSFRKSSVSSVAAAASASAQGGSANGPGPSGSVPGTEKHTFTTRYGTKENIYEDVGAGSSLGVAGAGVGAVAAKPGTSTSMQSFESVGKFNFQDELRLVQSQHDRILGELNLSVETLIMPSKDEQDAIDERLHEMQCAAYHDEMSADDCVAAGSSGGVVGGVPHMHLQQERLSPTTSQPNSGDVDSGISGSSSSGASYSSSMLYRTTAMYNGGGGGGGSGSSKTVTINDNAEGSGSGMSMMAGGSSIRSSCGSSSGGCDRTGGYSSCGGGPGTGASCSKISNVIPNSNRLTCCFYSDKLGRATSRADQLDASLSASSGVEKSSGGSFWNKLGKLRISGVFGNNNSSNSSSSSTSSNGIANGQHFHHQHLHHQHLHHQPVPFQHHTLHTLHHHQNHTLAHPHHHLLNHSAPTTTTNTATMARSNECYHHHHMAAAAAPPPPPPMVTVTGPAPTTIEPWWQSSDLCPCQAPLPCMEPPSCCSLVAGGHHPYEYQLPCEVLVPPPPTVAPRPPLPQPPLLHTQIELEEDGEEDAVGAADQEDPKTEQEELGAP